MRRNLTSLSLYSRRVARLELIRRLVYSIPVPTAASNANVTSDVSSMAKPGTSKDLSSEMENEHTDVTAEADVPTANTSSESTSTLTGRNSSELTAESSLRDETESSSEQETLRRRRLQKFSSQLSRVNSAE